MFGLPKNTEYKKQLSKSKIFENLDLTSKQTNIIDNNISTLYIVNSISKDTISQLSQGETIKSIWLILANLKKDENIEEVSTLILKSIPHSIILILQYENKYRLGCYYNDRVIISDYIDDSYKIELNGSNLDNIYEDIVSKIGNIVIKDNYTLTEQIEENDKINSLKKEIKILENKCKNEKQFNKKVEINKKINSLKDELKRII